MKDAKEVKGLLGLGSGSAEIHGNLNILQVLDFSISSFKTIYIFTERFHKSLGMLGRENDPGFYLALGSARHHVNKIDNEFSMTMGYDGQVGVFPFSYLFADLYVELIGILGSFHF
jgi:hypothetical protein